MLLSKARQRSDSGSVLYEKKFRLSSSQCFVLICLGEKICVGVLFIESSIKLANCVHFYLLSSRLYRNMEIHFKNCLVDTCCSFWHLKCTYKIEQDATEQQLLRGLIVFQF